MIITLAVRDYSNTRQEQPEVINKIYSYNESTVTMNQTHTRTHCSTHRCILSHVSTENYNNEASDFTERSQLNGRKTPENSKQKSSVLTR